MNGPPNPNGPYDDGWITEAGLQAPLLPGEQLLLQTLATGTAVDLRTTAAGDDTEPVPVPVRANLVRAIVRGLYLSASEIDPHGVQITGAHIEERLDLDDVTFTRPLTFTHCTLKAGIAAERATLHTLALTHCIITAPNSDLPAVMLDDAHISRGLSLIKSHITGMGEHGAVRLLEATIGGQLDCGGSTFANDAGPALGADGLTTTGHVSLAGEFAGEGEHGAVWLLGASIGGQLICGGGTFTSTTGPALVADGLTATSDVFLAGEFTGESEHGAVRLRGASIGGQLDCEGGTFTNTTGPALAADGLTATGDVFLAGEFAGEGADGAVQLSGARIGGSLVCRQPGSVMSRWTGALNLTGVHIEQNWFLDPGFRAAGTPAGWLNIDGLTYQGLPQGTDGAESAKTWAAILSHQTVKYAAQPWQHLAAAHQAAGHVEDATTLFISQQDDRGTRIIKQKTGSRSRAWLHHRASKFFTRYGYRASRTVAGLCIWAIIGIFVAVGIGQITVNTGKPTVATSLLTHKPDTTGASTTPPASCSLIEQIGLGLEWSVPILTTKASDTCQLNTTHPTGQWLTAATWVLRLIGWALATIAIAGYTGIIKRI